MLNGTNGFVSHPATVVIDDDDDDEPNAQLESRSKPHTSSLMNQASPGFKETVL
jgi:hypothetical protein